MERLFFSIDPIAPFRLDLTVRAIRRRRENAIDLWDGDTYERVLAVESRPVLLNVRQSGTANAPRLHITVRAAHLPKSVKAAATAALECLFGLRVSHRSFYRVAAQHRRLHEIASRFRGLKPPCFSTVREGLINGIACQHFSLTVGIILPNRLTALAELPFENDDSRRAFPRPEDVSTTTPQSLRSLGFNAFKTCELIGFGKKIGSGDLCAESFTDLSNEEPTTRLLDLPGVGRWTAEYVFLRSLGRTDVFPKDDIGTRNSLARWLHLRKTLDYSSVTRILDRW